MKTLGRILIILLAAAIVIGGTYALLQTSAAQALVGQPIGFGGENGNRPARPDFASGQGRSTGEMRGDHEGQGGSWATVIRNFVMMAVIVAAVQVVWSIGRWIKRSAERRHRLLVSRS
jgi:hypothetical protein